MAVWDLEVAGDHSYAAGGLFHHNSLGPNLQNIPTRHKATALAIRKAFFIEPGRARIYCDYSQIELRLLAWVTGSANLTQAYHSLAYEQYLAGGYTYEQYLAARSQEESVDVHGLQAINTFGADPEADNWKVMRRAAKIINFGVPYGMGWRGLNENPELLLPEAKAKGYHATYHNRNPEIGNAKIRLFAHMKSHRPIPRFVNWAGRARHGPRLLHRHSDVVGDAERSLFASLIQGSAGELTRFSLVRLWWLQKCNGLPAGAISTSTVHDEIQVDCDIADVPEVARTVQREMENFHGLFGNIPVVADLEVTTSTWADKKDYADWAKGAV